MQVGTQLLRKNLEIDSDVFNAISLGVFFLTVALPAEQPHKVTLIVQEYTSDLFK